MRQLIQRVVPISFFKTAYRRAEVWVFVSDSLRMLRNLQLVSLADGGNGGHVGIMNETCRAVEALRCRLDSETEMRRLMDLLSVYRWQSEVPNHRSSYIDRRRMASTKLFDKNSSSEERVNHLPDFLSWLSYCTLTDRR